LPARFAAVKEAPVAMVVPLVILAMLCIGLGIAYPLFGESVLQAARDSLLDKLAYMGYIIGG
jgi:formate hydrogenlyase subunit 3/multisubunit Na+/H+ antiporter MnhD subunit